LLNPEIKLKPSGLGSKAFLGLPKNRVNPSPTPLEENLLRHATLVIFPREKCLQHIGQIK
jgi:hypothetical protein